MAATFEHTVPLSARKGPLLRPTGREVTLRCEGTGGSGRVRKALSRLRLMRNSLVDSTPRVKYVAMYCRPYSAVVSCLDSDTPQTWLSRTALQTHYSGGEMQLTS